MNEDAEHMMPSEKEALRLLRERLWAGHIITREHIADGLIPVEHLQGSPEWNYDPETGNWYNDSKIADLVTQKAEQHMHRANLAPGSIHDMPYIEPTRRLLEALGNIDNLARSVVEYDSGGLMGKVLGDHLAQLEYWGKLGEAKFIRRDLNRIGFNTPKTAWTPPMPETSSGFLCINCGSQYGTGSRCEACHRKCQTLHIVDGRVVE